MVGLPPSATQNGQGRSVLRKLTLDMAILSKDNCPGTRTNPRVRPGFTVTLKLRTIASISFLTNNV